MPTEVELSIIIVNWNVKELLRACLASLRRFPPARGRCEIIVVDNSSSDGSVEMVREEFPEVRLIANAENAGFARANNQVFSSACGEFILLLNPDTELREPAIDRVLELMRAHPEIAVAGPRLLNSDGSFQRAAGGAFPTLRNVAWHWLFLDRAIPARLGPPPMFFIADRRDVFDTDWISGAAMMLRRGTLGGRIFDDEFFMYGEDMELCHRMKRAGQRVVFVGDCAIVHHNGASMEKQQSPAILASIVKGPRAFFRMHHGRAASVLYDVIMTAGWMLRWAGFNALSVIRPGHGMRQRAAESGRCARLAASAMLGR